MRQLAKTIEWRTVGLAIAIYGGWFALTAVHTSIPAPILAILGGWLIAWHGSLQHETIHGHPTRVTALNDGLGFVPLALWLPYRLYKRSHMAHHNAPAITDPLHDPESRYRLRPGGVAARLRSTLLGQLLLGPPWAIVRFLLAEAGRAVTEPGRFCRDWALHLVAVAGVLWWLDRIGLGLGRYLLLFVYPGTALTMLRSFAEHRADLASPGRAAIVERGGLLGLLYLNNNLHAAHHDRPRLPWYELPEYHRRHRARFVGQRAPVYRGYGEIVRRFAFRSHDDMLHPAHRLISEGDR